MAVATRPRNRERTHERILAATVEVVARHGYRGATILDIAAQAGVTNGAVQDHFGTKEKLVAEAVLFGLEQSDPSTVSLNIRRCAEPKLTDRRKFALSVSAASRSSEEIAKAVRELVLKRIDHTRASLQEAAEAGHVRDDVDVDVLAWVLTYLFVGFGAMESQGFDPPEPDELERLFLALLAPPS